MKKNNLRKSIISMLCIVSMLAFYVVPASAAGNVTLTVGTVPAAAVDTIVTIPITASEVGDIMSFGFKIDYDRSKLEFVGWDSTGIVLESWWGTLTKSNTTDVNTNMNKPAVAYLNGSAEPISTVLGVSGSGILAKIQFKVLAPGANITVPVALSATPGEVSVDDETSIKTVTLVDGGLQAAPVAVTGVTLDNATLSLIAGGTTGTLTETVNPAEATNKAVTWSSNNEAVATVANGVVTPLTAGTATITVTTVDGTKTATSTVTVTAAPVAVTGVTLAPATLDLIVGGATGTLTETVNPAGATNKAVTWSSNAEAVATVASGVVTPLTAGTATITVTTVDGTKTATSEVTVKDVSTILFADGATVSKVYNTTGYTNTISGDGDGTVTYTSGTPATATIDSSTGEVTLVGVGTTVITATKAATSTHATVTNTYTLTVTEKELTVSGLAATYNPGAAAGSGSITITGTPVLEGIINSDAVNLTGTASGSISGSTASEAVTVIGLTLAGEKAANYTLTLPTGLTVDATVVLPASTIVFADGATVSKVYNTTGYTNTISGDGDGTVTYTSSTPATATINSSGEVTLVGVGTTVITATKAATSTHATVTDTYTLTVTQKGLTVSGLGATYNPGATAGSGSITITGTPVLEGIINSDTVTFTGTASGSISGSTASEAVTVIGLTLAGEKAANYTLTLPTGLTVDATVVLPASTIVFANGATVTKVYGTTGYINTISGDGTGAVTYTSGTPATATINSSTGEVTLVEVGTTVITATKAATSTHATVTNTYTLTVTAAPSTIVFTDGTAVSKNYGTTGYTNTISGDGTGAVTYTSGTPAIATINSSTGVVTLVGVGETVITATKAATLTHATVTNTYTLTVTVVEITAFDAIANVSAGTAGSATYADAAAVITALPTTATANTSAVTVPVTTWVDTDTYNPAVAGSYTFTATLGTIPTGYANAGGFTATVEVVVAAPVSSGGSSGGGRSSIQPTAPAANGTIQVNYTATGGTAVLALPRSKVDEIIAKSKNGEVDIDLSKVSGVTSAELPKTAVTAINEAGLDVTVKLPAGSITLNEDATVSIVGQAEGGSLKLELKQVAKGSLTDVQKQAVKSNDMVLDINISSGTKKISSFDGTLSITVPYSGPQPVAVWYLNDKGELEKLSCTFVDGTVSFDLDHLSLYVVGQDTAWVNPFADVKESDWFYISVEYAFENGLMVGTSDANFSPYTNTTRGMIVTMLHRLEGTPKSDTANAFTDVGSDKYYTNAVAWASDNTIVSGYGNGMFGPEDAITREQMAVILMNYAKYKGYDVSLRADLSKFADGESISPWAKDAISWANAEGLIQGSGSQLMPADNALRCQVAAILQRFIETIAK